MIKSPATSAIKHVFFDFDQTISRIHVFKQLAGTDAGVSPPHCLSERGHIHRLAELNASGRWAYDDNTGLVVLQNPENTGSVSWTNACLGGPARINELRELLSQIQHVGARATIITKGYVGAVQYILANESLSNFFHGVYGKIGTYYGESDYDKANQEPSPYEGAVSDELKSSKAKLIVDTMTKEGLQELEAVLIEDDTAEIDSVIGICRSMFVSERRGIPSQLMIELQACIQRANVGLRSSAPPAAAATTGSIPPASAAAGANTAATTSETDVDVCISQADRQRHGLAYFCSCLRFKPRSHGRNQEEMQRLIRELQDMRREQEEKAKQHEIAMMELVKSVAADKELRSRQHQMTMAQLASGMETHRKAITSYTENELKANEQLFVERLEQQTQLIRRGLRQIHAAQMMRWFADSKTLLLEGVFADWSSVVRARRRSVMDVSAENNSTATTQQKAECMFRPPARNESDTLKMSAIASGTMQELQVAKSEAIQLPQASFDPGVSSATGLVECSTNINSFARLRQVFSDCDTDGSGYITPDELARWWASAAARQAGRFLDAIERSLIAASVERSFQVMDTDKNGWIGGDEWLHNALLDMHSQGPAVSSAIAARIREMDWRMSDLVSGWEEADPHGRGLIPHEQVAGMPPTETQNELLNAMKVAGKIDISYVEYCVHVLGLDYTRVELRLYDLSRSTSSALSALFLGRKEEGIWHTGVAVFGNEYYYYGTICIEKPGEANNPFGTPTKTLELGLTLRTEADLDDLLGSIGKEFQPELYDVFEHNCVHLSERLVRFLLGRSIPNSVRLQCERIKSAAAVKALKPLLNEALGGRPPSKASTHAKESLRPRKAAEAGQLVLVELPDCITPVVAHAYSFYDDGTSDLFWIDGAGNRREIAGLRSDDLVAWKTTDIYTDVMKALEDGDVSRRCRSSMMLQVDAADMVHRSNAMSPKADRSSKKCPKGHFLAAKELSFWQGRLQTQYCNTCSKSLPHSDFRMYCHICDYLVCQACWMKRKPSCAVSHVAGMASIGQAMQLHCSSGHSLERLSGQTVCGDRSCSQCGRQELGATAPYFFSCRPCCYDLCPECARDRIIQNTT